MKWVVTGGRKFADIRFIYDKLDGLAGDMGLPSLLIHGGALGVDTICGRWAQCNQVPVHVERIKEEEWIKYHHTAGPIRNSRMLDLEPDFAIIFPGGNGTLDMYRKIVRAEIDHVVFTKDTFI